MKLIDVPISDQSNIIEANWDYIKDDFLGQVLQPKPFEKELKETSIDIEDSLIGKNFFMEEQYQFFGSPRPYLPTEVEKLIQKARKKPLKEKEMINLMDKIAKTSVDFYNIKKGKYIAIGFNGKIVESADTSLDLLSKIQGKKYNTQIFVWHVGSDVFAGWRT